MLPPQALDSRSTSSASIAGWREGGKCSSDFLRDEEHMLFGPLVIFEMPNDAAGVGDDLKRFGDAKDAVINGRSHARIQLFLRAVQAAHRPDEDSTWRQRITEPSQNTLASIQGNMPDAVPRGDEVIRLRGQPLAHIHMVKRTAGMLLLRQGNHLGGDIKALDVVFVALQQSMEATAAPTADIKRPSAPGAKLQRVLMLANSIRGEMRPQPLMSNGIVALGGLGGLHDEWV